MNPEKSKNLNSSLPTVLDIEAMMMGGMSIDTLNRDGQGGIPLMESDPKENNIIMFPGKSRNRPPQSLEEICKNVELAKTTRIEEVTEAVIINLFEDLYDHLYDFTERNDANKDMAFLIEAVKSLMHRHDGLDHQFHSLAEHYFAADESGDLTFIGNPNIVEVTEIEKES
jgi:hypothetical protein